MKNKNEKESLGESDLEEGEIPEFEVRNADSTVISGREGGRNHQLKNSRPGGAPEFGRMKDSLPVRIQSPSQGGLIKNVMYFSTEKGRYELPSAEGECVPEELKSIIRNQVPQNTFYDYNLMERRLKYLHPFQTTYGSVEHIMTKIGETLGRSNDSYYMGRRSNDPRNVIKLNSNIGASFRESGSLFRRYKSNYHKRRRYSESDSNSDREAWGTSGKFKSRTDQRRKEEKDFKKKRKTKFSDGTASETETKKHAKVSEKADDSVKPNVCGNERLIKAIRELQARECEAAEVPFADEVPKVSTVNSDDNQENFSEKSSVNEDSDDDVELIKLRLLALTSNKRKNQVLAEEKLNEIEEEKLEDQKGELTDDEKEPENSQVPDNVIICKDNNDIDRYELMLRAEALKTALLRKHKHRIKKRKYSISVSLDDGEEKVPEKRDSELREEETKAKDDESSFPISGVSIVTISVSKNDSVSESRADASTNLENSLDCNGPDLSEKCVDPNLICEADGKVVGLTNVTGKKIRKRRLKKGRRFGGMNSTEISIKENSRVPDEEDQKAKALLPDSVCQKKAVKEHEKKFVLVDSSQLSKSQSTGDNRLSMDLEQSDNAVSAKTNELSAATIPKIPETEIQRIIVHLGSDSSDEEALTTNHLKTGDPPPKEPENVEPPCTTSCDASSKLVDYEKSVELLLKDARRRIESKLETPQRIPPTPEAVYNHLAPSQRLEYIRLKQKIAETEKLRRMKENNTSAANEIARKNQLNSELPNNKTSSSVKTLLLKTNWKDSAIAAGKSSIASPVMYKNNKKIKNNLRLIVREGNGDRTTIGAKMQREGNAKLKNVAMEQSAKNGSVANSVSVAKNILERKKTLTQNQLHLERLKVLWKKIKMEKMIEDKCKNELKRLKIQQNFFELKISQQRTKIKKLAEESKQIYEAFQKVNKGLAASGKKKKTFVAEKIGSEIKVDSANISGKCSEVEPDVPAATKKEDGILVEKSKSLICVDGIVEVKEENADKGGDAATPENDSEKLKEYNSPLQRPSTGSESLTCRRVDPNTIMCQYDLTGRCNDEECPYQHVRA